MDSAWAMIVLSMMPGTPERIPPSCLWSQARTSLQEYAIHIEVMDRREVASYFVRREDYQADLDTIRLRIVELKDAPMIGDAYRFPDTATLNERCLFNRTYRKRLVEMMELELDRSKDYEVAIAETDCLYKTWDLCRDARCEFYYIHVRRRSLRDLKMRIGDELYNRAELPDNVPIWRFREMERLYR